MIHLFIINPAAGSRNQTESYRKKIAKICTEKGLDYRIEISGAPGQCKTIANRAARSGEEYRIYACGGDGTLNEVVSGVIGYDNVSVTMFAGGSGNDFVRIFSEVQPFRDLERLLDCEEAQFSVIRCNDDYSLNICSVGLDARIGTAVASYKRLPLLSGFRAYALSALVNIIRGISEHYVIEINGERIDDRQTLICVCNGRFYGGGFNPIPTADPSDDVLEILLVKKVSRWKVLRVIGKYKNGRYADYPQYIRYLRTDHIKILCDRPTSINLDGELRTSEVMDISVAKEKIRFFYPKGLTWQKKTQEKTPNNLAEGCTL